MDILANVYDDAARAMLLFYEQWDASLVRDHPLLKAHMEDLDKGIDTNVIFALDRVPIHESVAVQAAGFIIGNGWTALPSSMANVC